jgi:arabinogalactan oligomer/maltooligosaccharide transport system substrate-binding protein
MAATGMMGALPRLSVPHPCHHSLVPRRWRRLAGVVATMLGGLGLAGCSPRVEVPVVLTIGVGVDHDQTINVDLEQEFRDRLRLLERGFRKLDPHVHFRFSLYPEDELIGVMQRRQHSGLEPDLLFVTSLTAQRLHRAGVTVAYPVTQEQLQRFDPAVVRMTRLPDGGLSGLPELQQLQVSCFDRQRLPQPPTTVDALLKTSAKGVPVGLALANGNLYWTMGSLGALPAVERLLRGEPAGPAERQAIGRWLAWLADASLQQRVVFYERQDLAEGQLVSGQLAWIPCRSTALPRLRRLMGKRLGVAALPDGPGSMASAVNQIRVLALGSTSTQRARQAALAFSAFTINPMVQRAITLGSYTVLPVNRHVSIPVSSSRTLAALVRARDQGRQRERLLPLLNWGDQRPARVEELIVTLVFGEMKPEDATTRLIRILQQPQ